MMLMNASTKGDCRGVGAQSSPAQSLAGYELGVQGRSLVVRITDALQGQRTAPPQDPRARYKVINWPEYDRALQQPCNMLTLSASFHS